MESAVTDPLAALAAVLARCRQAQAAVDAVLTPGQQAEEQFADGTYRVRCSTCGQSVSTPLPVPVIVRGVGHLRRLHAGARLMGGGLRAGLLCPVCGQRVVGVLHEWSGTHDTATFEYHHLEDVARDRRGEAPVPCVVVLSYAEGLTRMEQETAPVRE